MGLSSAYELSERGERVLGLEQFSPLHEQGSSHGESRIIRRAYFEHQDYIPLLNRAYELWRDLEKKSGRSIFEQVGLIICADSKESVLYQESLKSAQKYSIPVSELAHAEIGRQYPTLRPPTSHQGLFEPGAGFLRVDEARYAFLELAQKKGAKLEFSQKILAITPHAQGVTVKTDQTTYEAKRVVLTAGAWAQKFLPGLELPLKLYRVFLYWFKAQAQLHYQNKHPCFAFHLPHEFYYGFPSLDGKTVKLAGHFGKDLIENPQDKEVISPDPLKLADVQKMIAEHLPMVDRELVRFSTCLYTMTPDEHFVIDSHPHFPQVVFATGFSGHGFKFAPVIGEILADLVLHGQSRHAIEFLRRERLIK